MIRKGAERAKHGGAWGSARIPLKSWPSLWSAMRLNFQLLSDEDHAAADKYGAWGPKKFMGREFDGILRTTFIVG